jgi:signal transduction histidine kinase/CheY-like chemotaxis protein/HPt (histidine-containing phosphotransfer) domain-containing protein
MDIKGAIRKNKLQLAFVVMSFFLMIFTSSLFLGNMVEKQMRADIDRTLSSAETSVSYRINLVNVALDNAASFIQERLDNGESSQQVLSEFYEISQMLSRQLSGQLSLTDFYGCVNGDFFSSSGKPQPEAGSLTEQQWYQEAVLHNSTAVFVASNSDQNGKKVITAAKRLRGWYGELYGVIAVDIDISAITQSIKELYFKDGGYGWLLDPDLYVLASANDSFIGKQFNMSAKQKSALAGDSEEITFTKAPMISGDTRIAVFNWKRIENGWYIGITTPVGSYYKKVISMAAILSVLGLAFMLILSYLLIRLSVEKTRSDEENKSKSSFLAKMSHEIRTPMNSILSISELIMRKNTHPETKEYIGIINHSAKTLLSIINDILDFSLVESGRLEIENKQYHFSSMMNDLINVIRLRLSDKQVDFFVTTDPNIPEELIGDDVRVRQIVSNLLTNAVKYTVKGYISLDVSIGKIEGKSIELIFAVEDSGTGIKKENIDKLFVEFKRFGKNKSIEGTGLGLVIARAYCALMGGTISVDSVYGQGSEFTANVFQSFESDKKSASIEGNEDMKILVFEPHETRLKSMVTAMTSLGLNPAIATTLAEFMDKLDECLYDYAFISSKYAIECLEAFKNDKLSTQFVVMIEIGDIAAFKDVSSIMMPAYSISIANILSGTRKDGSDARYAGKQFSAPDAKILVVDDLPTNLKVAKEVISHFGLSVDTCLSGKEAINLVQSNVYDIVFMDHMMPEMDGLEATAAIRAMGGENEYFLTLPIIALTANAISGQKEMFLANGMNDFLSKPIEMNKLVNVMKKWIPKEKQKEIDDVPQDAFSEQIGGFKVEGIDIATGFTNTGRSMSVYKGILRDFCRDANDVIVQLKKAEQEEDTEKYAILAHSLKGVARSVGAMELGQFAALLEENAKAGNTIVLHSRTNALWENVRVLIENIYTALAMDALMSEDDKSSSGQTPKINAHDLEKLKKSLGRMDIATVNDILMDLLAMPLDQNTKSLISEIEQDVLLFEYDMAIEKINRLL